MKPGVKKVQESKENKQNGARNWIDDDVNIDEMVAWQLTEFQAVVAQKNGNDWLITYIEFTKPTHLDVTNKNVNWQDAGKPITFRGGDACPSQTLHHKGTLCQ